MSWALALCVPPPPPPPGLFSLVFLPPPAWFGVSFLPPSSPCSPPLLFLLLLLFFFFFFQAACFAPPPPLICFVGLPRLGSPCAPADFLFSAWPLAASLRLLPPPPPLVCVSRLSSLPLGVPCFPFAVFLLHACLEFVGGARCPPPPPGVLPLVLSGVAALCRPFVWFFGYPGAVFSAACCAVGRRLALLWAAMRCAVFFGVGFCVLCCAVGCCYGLCRVSGLVVRLRCYWSALLCVVLCCVPGCAAAPRCCALFRPAWCCCVLCCFVSLLWGRRLLCRALGRCLLPVDPVSSGAVFCGVSPCCVLCGCVFCCGVLLPAVARGCALCCVLPGVLCCAFPVLSARCGAVLRCAGALALC